MSPRGVSSKHIYAIGPVIRAGDQPILKIGKSCDPTSRCRSLQAGSPVELMIYESWNFHIDASEIEAECHRRFMAQHSHGEWFSVDVSDVTAFIDELASNHWVPNGSRGQRYRKLIFERSGPIKVCPLLNRSRHATFVSSLAAKSNLERSPAHA